MIGMNSDLAKHIELELDNALSAQVSGNLDLAFSHLERAHVLGQSSTLTHTRVHWAMLKVGLKRRDVREIWGQIVRIVGAATKTPFGIYPTGNTGGANVWFFKPLPIPLDLQRLLDCVDVKISERVCPESNERDSG